MSRINFYPLPPPPSCPGWGRVNSTQVFSPMKSSKILTQVADSYPSESGIRSTEGGTLSTQAGIADSYPSESGISSTERSTLGIQAAGRTGPGLAAAWLNTKNIQMNFIVCCQNNVRGLFKNPQKFIETARRRYEGTGHCIFR